MDVPRSLSRLVRGERLDATQAEAFFDHILHGRADDAQIAAALAMMQMRGVCEDELLGGARSLRRHAIKVPTEGIRGIILDTCGTGGAAKTFNVSTIAAFVVAAAAPGSIYVAKHGNKSRSGRGSAELLQRLGVNVEAGVTAQSRCLRECGVCFCFAVAHHPAARHAAQARRSLAFPTIFNLLGPLCNPAGATHQVMGVFDATYVEPMARTLANLGSVKSVVLHGADGLDELSTTGLCTAAWADRGSVTLQQIDPLNFGVPRAQLQALLAPDLDESVSLAQRLLRGKATAEDRPRHEMVALSAALALFVCDAAPSISEGLDMATAVLARGDAMRVLEQLARLSNESPR